MYYVVSFLWWGLWLGGQFALVFERQSELISGLPRVGGDGLATFPVEQALAGTASYFGVMLLLHVALAWASAAAFKTVLLPCLRPRQRLLTLLAQLLLMTLALSFAGAWLYPQSAMGDVLGLALLQPSTRVIAIALLFASVAILLIWVYVICRRSRPTRVVLALIAVALVLPGAGLWFSVPRSASVQAPDVIIIGIDSLRPDHLQRNHAPFRVMPQVEALLDRSVVFDDALSTQPHTSPATTSVLTGQWPAHSGARGNLFPASNSIASASMAHAFAAAGYETMFAMDETRFANIDQVYGFQRILSPGMGVSEMLLGVLGDNVLSNLLMAAPVSRALTPNVYGNRAHVSVYRPEAFSRRLTDGVQRAPANKPLFLYVHFCMAHWPYQFSRLGDEDRFEDLPAGEYADANPQYLRGLATADQQVAQLLDGLRRNGRLNNAIVVVMSDHGEDFDLRKDLWPDGEIQVPGGIVNGHGGSAIRAPQTSVLLAFTRFGEGSFVPTVRHDPASLVDVAPTVLKAAGVADHVMRDGRDLLTPNQIPMNNRIRFVESSYFPGSLRKSEINEGAVLREMASMYRITSAGRVEVKPQWMAYQISHRQRAAYLGDWVLMAAETPDDGLLVIDRTARRGWRMQDAPPQAPLKELHEAWCEHWKMDDAGRLFCHLAPAVKSISAVTAVPAL